MSNLWLCAQIKAELLLHSITIANDEKYILSFVDVL